MNVMHGHLRVKERGFCTFFQRVGVKVSRFSIQGCAGIDLFITILCGGEVEGLVRWITRFGRICVRVKRSLFANIWSQSEFEKNADR